MTSRTQVTLNSELQRRARDRAAQLGVSFAEYIRRLVVRDLGEPRAIADPSSVFNLGRTVDSDVAAGKRKMIAEALLAEQHFENTGR